MSTVCERWDVAPGNLVVTVETEDAAPAVVRDLNMLNDPESAEALEPRPQPATGALSWLELDLN